MVNNDTQKTCSIDTKIPKIKIITEFKELSIATPWQDTTITYKITDSNKQINNK